MKGDLETAPSEMFQDLVCDSGSPSMDCQLCGRTHFCAGEGSCEEPEQVERYRMSAAANPERFCEYTECDGLSFGTINGMQVVYGCPCNKLWKYEAFIWEHRELIVAYIRRRTAKELELAKRMGADLAGL